MFLGDDKASSRIDENSPETNGACLRTLEANARDEIMAVTINVPDLTISAFNSTDGAELMMIRFGAFIWTIVWIDK